MQVPRFVKCKKGLPRKICCTREAPPPTPSHTSRNTHSHNGVQLLKNTVANVKMPRHTNKFSTSQKKHTNRSSHEKKTKFSTNKEYCWQITCTNSPWSHVFHCISPWSDPFYREIPHLCAHCATRSAGSTKELVHAKSRSALPPIEGIHSKKVCTSPFPPAIQKCGPMIHRTVHEKFIDMVPQESKNQRRKGVRKLTVALQGEGPMVHTHPSSPRPPSPMGHQGSIHRQWPGIQQGSLAVDENQNKVNSENSSLPSCLADVVSFPSHHSHVVSLHSCNEHVLKVQRLTEQAITPTSAHEDDAGYDLYASAPFSIPPWSKALIPTDLAIQGPPGTYDVIADRSGLALKRSQYVLGGVVHRSYRGNVKVILYNGSSMPYEVQQGDKISPFILERFSKPRIVLVDELPASDRGISGFGSSSNSVQDTIKAGSNHITILNHQESQQTHPSRLMSDRQRFVNENESLQTKMADYLGYASKSRCGDVHCFGIEIGCCGEVFIPFTVLRPSGPPYKSPSGGADLPNIGTGVGPGTLRSTAAVWDSTIPEG